MDKTGPLPMWLAISGHDFARIVDRIAGMKRYRRDVLGIVDPPSPPAKSLASFLD